MPEYVEKTATLLNLLTISASINVKPSEHKLNNSQKSISYDILIYLHFTHFKWLLLFIIVVPFWLKLPVFSWGQILGALTLRWRNLAVKDESKRLRSASWRTSLCYIKTNQTVTVGSCLEVGAVGTCFFWSICLLWWSLRGETLPLNWRWDPE